MVDYRQDRIGAARRGENPTLLRPLPGAFAVIGDVQFLPGYCVLLSDRDGVDRLSDLDLAERLRFLSSLDLLAEAVERACAVVVGGFRRVNLEILGNTDAFLHAHVWPRYDWEPAEHVGSPVWVYPRARWSDPTSRLGPAHDPIRTAITDAIDRLIEERRVDSDGAPGVLGDR